VSGYANDRQWSDQFIPAITQIVGPRLLIPAPFDIDAKHAADLITLTARDITIACRVRRHGYLDKYGWEFTMRCYRASGAKTELEKITDGFGHWMFYAHALSNAPSDGFARWLLIDLVAWRAHMIRRDKSIKRGETANGDGTHFAWFDARTFPPSPPLLIASSEPLPSALAASNGCEKINLVNHVDCTRRNNQ